MVPLKAAASEFGEPHEPLEEWDRDWVEPGTGRALRRGLFVARVVGRSMEPRIPDGAHCLFASPVTGSRQGPTVLVRMRDEMDAETGQRFTVKRYRSRKTRDENGWRHMEIVLEPLNPAFDPIRIAADDETEVEVLAELVEVLSAHAVPAPARS